MSPFERLVRFKNPAGVTFYGEVELKETPTKETLVGASVTVYEGGDPWDDSFKLTEKREQIAELLSPLRCTPIFECVGLNYMKHATEAKVKPEVGKSALMPF